MHSSKQTSIKHLRSIQASKQAQYRISSKQADGPQARRLLACGHHCHHKIAEAYCLRPGHVKLGVEHNVLNTYT